MEKVGNAAYNEMVEITLPDGGETRQGQVLDTSKDMAVVQVFGPTSGMDIKNTSVRFLGSTARIGVSEDMLGRIFNGLGQPIDGGPEIVSKDRVEIVGDAINPLLQGRALGVHRNRHLHHRRHEHPGQGGPEATYILGFWPAAQRAGLTDSQAGEGQGQRRGFAVVFGAMGITSEEANYFINEFRNTGAISRAIMFLNLSSDPPSMERIILPRVALTTAEYLAYEKEMHVLVILTDMTNYCEALREISSAREEVPGRRGGFPGYMYTDLSTIYERAGKIRGQERLHNADTDPHHARRRHNQPDT